jgi:hypothetical protein
MKVADGYWIGTDYWINYGLLHLALRKILSPLASMVVIYLFFNIFFLFISLNGPNNLFFPLFFFSYKKPKWSNVLANIDVSLNEANCYGKKCYFFKTINKM